MFCTVNSTVKKYSKACKEEKTSLAIFNELDASADNARRRSWTKQEELAITHRGKYLSIYQVDQQKGIRKLSIFHFVY
jgi:hypothetical protein